MRPRRCSSAINWAASVTNKKCSPEENTCFPFSFNNNNNTGKRRGSISNKRLLYTVGNIPILDSWCDALFPAFHCTERVIELLDRSILKKEGGKVCKDFSYFQIEFHYSIKEVYLDISIIKLISLEGVDATLIPRGVSSFVCALDISHDTRIYIYIYKLQTSCQKWNDSDKDMSCTVNTLLQ